MRRKIEKQGVAVVSNVLVIDSTARGVTQVPKPAAGTD
jgi:hypothetical protein